MRPSGAHAGRLSVLVNVNCTGFEPSAFMTQMSLCGTLRNAWVELRLLMKAIFVPSGDQAGCCPLPSRMRTRPVPSGLMTQIADVVPPFGLGVAGQLNTILPFAPGGVAWAAVGRSTVSAMAAAIARR